jgi:hypothetical protein
VFIRIPFPLEEIEVIIVVELGIQNALRNEALITMRIDFDPRRRVLWLVAMTWLVFLEERNSKCWMAIHCGW